MAQQTQEQQSNAVLLATIQALSDLNQNLQKQNQMLLERINELTAQVAYLNRQLFGRKSEKLRDLDPRQLHLFEEEMQSAVEEAAAARDEAVDEVQKMTPSDKKEKRRVRTMTENLPVLKRTVLEPEGIDHTKYKKIGEEITRLVHFQPGKLYVKEIVRPKYGLIDNLSPVKRGEGVKIAPMPLLPIYIKE